MSTFRQLLMSKRTHVSGLVLGACAYGKSNVDEDREYLRDYSGNKRDIRLYNFAFAGMSGYGGYTQDWNFRPNNSIITATTTTTTGKKVRIDNLKDGAITIGYLLFDDLASSSLDVETRINGGSHGVIVRQTERGGRNAVVLATINAGKTGSFVCTSENYNAGKTMIMVSVIDPIPVGGSAEFTILPQYPGALVSDGVDDYGRCIKGFALPDDYTVVAIRKIINGNNQGFVSKGSTQGAFIYEPTSDNSRTNAWSYGKFTGIKGMPALFSYQTKTSYNGQSIAFGSSEDTEDDQLFLFTHSHNGYNEAALYDLRIYDHSLTDDELQLVKDEMMEDYEKATGGGIADIHYVADWDGKGRPNDEEEPARSEWIDKVNGKVMNLHNYAFAGMSGWNGYPTDFIESKWIVLDTTAYQKDLVMVESLRLRFKGVLTEGHTSCGIVLSNANIPEKAIKYRLRVKGIKGNQFVRLRNESTSPLVETILREDGTIEMDISRGPTSGSLYIYMFSPNAATPDVDITIEMLPLYPGALCSDGVDDYGRSAEPIDEEVGTMLAFAEELELNKYLMRCINADVDSAGLLIYRYSDGTITLGRPNTTVPADGAVYVLTRTPAVPDSPLFIQAINSAVGFGKSALYRLILIREQLDGAQVEFLKWKVDKEYRDWLKQNGYRLLPENLDLEVTPESLDYSKEGGQKQITITTDDNWTIS